MKLLQQKFASFQRKKYESLGCNGRSVDEVFPHLLRFMDRRLLRNAPDINEIEYQSILTHFCKCTGAGSNS